MLKLVCGLALVLVAAMLSNPSRQDHLEALSENNVLKGGLARLGALVGGVDYNNYAIASTLSFDGTPFTLGLFKNVIVLKESNPE